MLYGVTMGADGVSQIVSRRLPREDEVAADGVALTLPRRLLARHELPGVFEPAGELVFVNGVQAHEYRFPALVVRGDEVRVGGVRRSRGRAPRRVRV